MKLKYYVRNKKKIYTLKESEKTRDAHYKFIKVRDVKQNGAKQKKNY